MTVKSPEVIYLIDTGDGVAWCGDPDPTGYGECDDAVKYVRWNAYEALQAERDAAFALLRECQLILREECGARIDYVELNAFLEGNASAMDILAACGQGGDV